MILAWVISLILLCSSLLVYLERLTTLRVIESKIIQQSQQAFIASEKAVLECEQNLSVLATLHENGCFIQPIAKNVWLISSKQKPVIQVHVVLDEKSGFATRLNWRQVFE
jgi:hypothetical protein